MSAVSSVTSCMMYMLLSMFFMLNVAPSMCSATSSMMLWWLGAGKSSCFKYFLFRKLYTWNLHVCLFPSVIVWMAWTVTLDIFYACAHLLCLAICEVEITSREVSTTDVYRIMIGSFLWMSSTSNFMELFSFACAAPANGTSVYDLQIEALLTIQSYAML